MFKTKELANAVRFALLGGAVATAMTSLPVLAAEGEEVERIEVTGSAIKRTDIEGSLPVQVVTAEDIAKSGITSVGDLIQKLPAMQGFTSPGESVGGGGGGLSTASIHDIGEDYTLVLLNGRRVAPSDSGSTVDLNAIPISAIERVEVLTDGASALYGSDAIAGVVNFILKKNVDTTTVSVRADQTAAGGGDSWTGSIVTGFGNRDTQGFNISATFTHDDKKQLKATERDFAKTGIINFWNNGRELQFFNGSGNAIPGNARVRYTDADGVTRTRTFNPYASETGDCADGSASLGTECFYDYTREVEITPESTRDSLFLDGAWDITDNLALVGTALISQYDMTTRIASYPTGWFTMPSDSAPVVSHVLPHLSEQELAGLQRVDARWRANPAGGRETEWSTLTTHLVLGVEGTAFDDKIDYSTAATYSKTSREQNYTNGWLLQDEFFTLARSGAVDVFVPAGEVSSAQSDLLGGAVYKGNWDKTDVTLTGIDGRANWSAFELPEGDVQFAAGFDARNYQYERSISKANSDELILFVTKDTPYDFERASYGLFTEALIPVIEDLEVTASLRYDYIDSVDDKINGGSVGQSDSDITYKLSVAYAVTDELKLRGSYGTGFKAPSMLAVAEPRTEFGVTSSTYSCPFPDPADPFNAYCLGDNSQYNVYREGNADLEFEESTQYTLGVVYAPSKAFNATVDYWDVEIENMVTSLTEDQIFRQANKYRDFYTTKLNTGTGEQELAIIRSAVNVGKQVTSGVDYSFEFYNELSFGELRTRFGGTYLMESEYTSPGTTDEWLSSMGRYGEDQDVSFRNVMQLATVLTVGDFDSTLGASYRSGYDDVFRSLDDCYVTTVETGDCVDVQLQVPSYITWDFQTKWHAMEGLGVYAGINNLFDREPGLSLQTGGAGHQLGYDPRYSDAYGRTYYLGVDYSF
ncbi:MAG: TonB-dependent receptor [Gammaproteobacteria bacterium]|nr:TonB-dependent receptor [Gammaproteobacteria bacterium]